MRTRLVVVLASLFALVSFVSSSAQVGDPGPGFPVTGLQIPVEMGSIDAANGNLHLEIPLGNFTQKGNLPLPVKLVYDSKIWNITDDGSGLSWQPNNIQSTHSPFASPGGWRLVAGQIQDTYAVNVIFGGCGQSFQNWRFVDSSGAIHPFGVVSTTGNCSGANQPQTGYALDGSGYVIVATGAHAFVYDQQGNRLLADQSTQSSSHNAPNGNVGVYSVDQNNNSTSTDTDGNLIDTLGRTPVTVTPDPNDSNASDYNVLITGGSRVTFVVTNTNFPYNTQFQQDGVADTSGSIPVIRSIKLPDGSSYSFSYNAFFGDLGSITLPTGGTISYEYRLYTDVFGNKNRFLSKRTQGSNVTTYMPTNNGCFQQSTCYWTVTSTRPSGDDTVYTFQYTAPGQWAYQTDIYTGSSTASGAKPLTTIASTPTYSTSKSSPYGDSPAGGWLTDTTTVTSYPGTNLKAQTKWHSDTPWTGQPSVVDEWDYTTGTLPLFPYRRTGYSYGATGGYTETNFPPRGSTGVIPIQHPGYATLLTGVDIQDTNSNYYARTDYGYDGTALIGAPAANQGTEPRGNLSSVIQGYLNGSVGSTTTYTRYADGVIYSSQDPNGNTTTYGYDPSHTFVTQVTRPTTTTSSGGSSQSFSHTTTSSADYSTGAVTQTNDENSVANGSAYPVAYAYYPPGNPFAGQLQSITYPDGGSKNFSYSPGGAAVYVSSALNNAKDIQSTGGSTLDAFGRPSSSSTAAGTVTTSYDANGRVQCVSHPATSSASTTDGSECVTKRDGLDRPLTITHPDGSTKTLSYSGNITTVTDELGKQMAYTNDAFGRLTDVAEPDSSGALNWHTAYTYDLLNNRTSSLQKGDGSLGAGQLRQWTYDAQSRLVSEQTPEAGLTCYGTISNSVCSGSYDANGNLTQKTDANGVVTSYTYDALNRELTETAGNIYNKFAYDSNPFLPGYTSSNAVGLPAASTNTYGVNQAYSYDIMGRLITHIGCSADLQNCVSPLFGAGANYDVGGRIHNLAYPDGRLLTYQYDTANRTTAVSYTGWNGQTVSVPAYFSSAQYTPTGQLSSAIYGNGVTLSASYNNRLVPSSMSYQKGTGGQTNTLWARTYTWDLNALNLTQTMDPLSSTTRRFSYDKLNRLTGVSGVAAGAAGSFTQTYAYDPWGNLSQSGVVNFNPSGFTNNRVNGLQYDAAGQVQTDPSGATFSYDVFHNLNPNSVRYDTEGRRLVKDARGYIYLGDQLLSVWDATSTSTGNYTDLIYANGQLIAEVPGTQTDQPTYRLNDNQGSLVELVDNTGNSTGVFDLLPYGQIISSTASDQFPFLGLENDPAYDSTHSLTRQLSTSGSRWFSPDSDSSSYDWMHPQSLNRYTYVAGQPLAYTDPSGLGPTGPGIPEGGNSGGGNPIEQIIGFIESLFGGGPSFSGTVNAPRAPISGIGGVNPRGIYAQGSIVGTILNESGISTPAGCEVGACLPTSSQLGDPQYPNGNEPSMNPLPYLFPAIREGIVGTIHDAGELLHFTSSKDGLPGCSAVGAQAAGRGIKNTLNPLPASTSLKETGKQFLSTGPDMKVVVPLVSATAGRAGPTLLFLSFLVNTSPEAFRAMSTPCN